MTGRLPAGVLVAALLKRVNDAGGLGVVRARGDDAGGILAIVEGAEPVAYERGFGPAGAPALIESRPGARDDGIESYWQRRRRNDPDLWVVALDIPAAERFIAETIL